MNRQQTEYFGISELRKRAFQQRASDTVWLEHKPNHIDFPETQAGEKVITPVKAKEFITAENLFRKYKVQMDTVQVQKLVNQRFRDYDKSLKETFEGGANGMRIAQMKNTAINLIKYVLGHFNAGNYVILEEILNDYGEWQEEKVGNITISEGSFNVVLSITAFASVIGCQGYETVWNHLRRISGEDAPKGFNPELLTYKRLSSDYVKPLGVDTRYTYVKITFKNWYLVFQPIK